MALQLNNLFRFEKKFLNDQKLYAHNNIAEKKEK